jgi:hypothetical protein
VGGDYLDEGNVDGADEATSGKFLDPIVRTAITIADDRISLRFRGENESDLHEKPTTWTGCYLTAINSSSI